MPSRSASLNRASPPILPLLTASLSVPSSPHHTPPLMSQGKKEKKEEKRMKKKERKNKKRDRKGKFNIKDVFQ